MWTPLLLRIPNPASTLVVLALGAACSKQASQVDAAAQQPAAASVVGADCARGSTRPSASPPAQGMWTTAGSPDGARIAAMIGPSEVRARSTVVTRTIETVEGAGDTTSLRVRLDDAVVRLELVPRYTGAGDGSKRHSARRDDTEPAAVYALTPLVSLASYEVCAGPPAVRYLRRDAHGRIEKDAMLYWVSTP